MGFLKNLGKGFAGIGGAAIEAGKLGGRAGKVAGAGVLGRGARIARENPTRLIAGIAGAAGIGAMLAEADGNVNSGTAAAKAGVVGFGLSAMSGTAGSALAFGGTGMASAGAMGVGALYSIGKASVKMPATKIGFDNMNEIKTSALGKVLLTGSALTEGAVMAKDAFYKSRTGVHDGMVRSATPVIPQELRQQGGQPNNAGATGDLVFALNNLRKG